MTDVERQGGRRPIRSCLYQCRVMHHRLVPVRHRFEHAIFLIYVDLDELQSLSSSLRLFSHNRRNIYSLRDSDHGLDKSGDLKTSCVRLMRRYGHSIPDDCRIALLTFPRIAGYVFNPVSFYFCSDSAGQPLCAIAEVGNTFGEMKRYVVPPDAARGGNRFRLRVPKHFYVSPFSDLEVEFDFKLRTPADTVRLAVDDYRRSETALVTRTTGIRRPLSDRTLLLFLFIYPFVTAKVITLIHWHALVLWLKRVPWHRKEARPDLQTGIIKPGRRTSQP